jgi:hypothetical protein
LREAGPVVWLETYQVYAASSLASLHVPCHLSNYCDIRLFW